MRIRVKAGGGSPKAGEEIDSSFIKGNGRQNRTGGGDRHNIQFAPPYERKTEGLRLLVRAEWR